jgi:hypothetical protein
MKLKLQTPLLELHQYEIAGLSSAMARKLALAVATFAYKNDLTEVTVEDLLNYFPMRYEDRSNLIQIDELTEGMEASIELYARVAAVFRSAKIAASKRRLCLFSRLPAAMPNARASRSSSGGSSPAKARITSSITGRKNSSAARGSSLTENGNGTDAKTRSRCG